MPRFLERHRVEHWPSHTSRSALRRSRCAEARSSQRWVLIMSRTPLFAAVKKALARSFHEQGLVVPRTSALTRRRLLRLSAAAAGAAALSPVLDWSAYAKQERPKGPVAIIGGGVAGLTAAYRLQAAGATPIVFEASNRWGGRMFTDVRLLSRHVLRARRRAGRHRSRRFAEARQGSRRGDAEPDHRRWRGPLFLQGTIPHAEGHGRSGEEDGRLCADSQADCRGCRKAHRQKRQLDGACPQAR